MDATGSTLETLRALPLFAAVDDDALAAVAAVATVVELPAGHVLIQPGQEGAGLFVIEDGNVTVEIGGRHVECGAGEFIGELSVLVEGLRHTGRVRAATPVRCLAISRHEFSGLLDAHPRLAVNMLPVLARRLADTDSMLAGS